MTEFYSCEIRVGHGIKNTTMENWAPPFSTFEEFRIDFRVEKRRFDEDTNKGAQR